MAGTAIDIGALRDRLLNLQADIEALVVSSTESRKPVELDQASVGRLTRMDAMQGQAMAVAVQRRRQDELLRIRAALRRIEKGEYGYCCVCGSEIAPARLTLDPAIPTCITCATPRK